MTLMTPEGPDTAGEAPGSGPPILPAPQAGASARVALTVTDADTALAMRSGDVPVLATPRVLALAEEAAVAAVRGALRPGETTVGAQVELAHLRPTRVGASVVAEAHLEAVEGRRLRFAFRVTEGGTEVARGRHLRVVVRRDGFG
jgi:fluoroacetyl-CoA thioesterase